MDPRAALEGLAEPPGGSSGGSSAAPPSSPRAARQAWQSGLFDRGSWVEAQPGWARSVITGRARLGGEIVPLKVMVTQMISPGRSDGFTHCVRCAARIICLRLLLFLWVEAQPGWAQSVITGHACLGVESNASITTYHFMSHPP